MSGEIRTLLAAELAALYATQSQRHCHGNRSWTKFALGGSPIMLQRSQSSIAPQPQL
jgi:hypothetical protein